MSVQRRETPALETLRRVTAGGVLWGALGGATYATVFLVAGALMDVDRATVSVGSVAVGLLWLVSSSVGIGLPIGLVVGLVAGVVAGLVLLVCEPLGDAAPLTAFLVTLLLLGGVPALLVSGDAEALTVLVLPPCAIAAWPLWRTLHRASRPGGAQR